MLCLKTIGSKYLRNKIAPFLHGSGFYFYAWEWNTFRLKIRLMDLCDYKYIVHALILNGHACHHLGLCVDVLIEMGFPVTDFVLPVFFPVPYSHYLKPHMFICIYSNFHPFELRLELWACLRVRVTKIQ